MPPAAMIDLGGAMARLTLYGIRTKIEKDRFHMILGSNDWSTLIQHDPATQQILVSRHMVDKFIDFVCQELKPDFGTNKQ
jgi:hypothetical protein